MKKFLRNSFLGYLLGFYFAIPVVSLAGVSLTAAGVYLTGATTYNVAIGSEALDSLTSGYYNVAIGYRVLTNVTTGTNNICIGKEACLSNIDGTYNIGIGTNSLQDNTTGDFNTALGIHTLLKNTGNNNTALGYNTLTENLDGVNNVGIGFEVLEANTSGYSNTAAGYNALNVNVAGAQHTAFGSNALQSHNAANNNNTAIGFGAGYNSGVALTGNANSTFLGADANTAGDFLNNVTVLGYQAQANISDSVVVGNSSIAGIGVTGGILTPSTMAVSRRGELREFTHAYTWTNAQVVALGATTAGDIGAFTIPAKHAIKNFYVIITGAAVGPATVTVACGRTGAAYIDYIVASDAKAAANTIYGNAAAERGTNLVGFDLVSYTATTLVNCHFISTGANLNTVTGSTGLVVAQTELVP